MCVTVERDHKPMDKDKQTLANRCNNILDKAHLYMCINDKYTQQLIFLWQIIVDWLCAKTTIDGIKVYSETRSSSAALVARALVAHFILKHLSEIYILYYFVVNKMN